MMATSTLEMLDALSRIRPLSQLETLRLERAVRRSSKRNERWHWTKSDDRRLIGYLRRGKKPAQIAFLLNRTERAIWRRMNRLGLGVRQYAQGKSSIALRVVK